MVQLAPMALQPTCEAYQNIMSDTKIYYIDRFMIVKILMHQHASDSTNTYLLYVGEREGNQQNRAKLHKSSADKKPRLFAPSFALSRHLTLRQKLCHQDASRWIKIPFCQKMVETNAIMMSWNKCHSAIRISHFAFCFKCILHSQHRPASRQLSGCWSSSQAAQRLPSSPRTSAVHLKIL